MPALENEKHEAFAAELAKGVKPSRAAIAAGYPKGSAASTGWRLALYPEIIGRGEELKQPTIQVKGTLLHELGRQCRATTVTDEGGRLLGYFFPVEASVSGVGA